MRPQRLPGFPYLLLVRLPLMALFVLAFAMVPMHFAGPKHAWLMYVAIAGLVLVGLTALIQLYAIPRGLWVLRRADGETSSLHVKALLAGSLHVGLLVYLVWMFRAVS